jgi:hypothetical protein
MLTAIATAAGLPNAGHVEIAVKAYVDGGTALVDAKYPGAGAWIENALLNSGCAQKFAAPSPSAGDVLPTDERCDDVFVGFCVSRGMIGGEFGPNIGVDKSGSVPVMFCDTPQGKFKGVCGQPIEPVTMTATQAQLAAFRLAYARQQQQVGALSKIGLAPQTFTAVRTTAGAYAPPLGEKLVTGDAGVAPKKAGGNALAIAAAAGLALLLLRR